MTVDVRHGDCMSVLPTLAENSIDSCVTDPPYHLTSIVKRFGGTNAAPAQFGTDGAYARASKGFMGKTWDGGDIAFRPELWREVYRVLKPGAHLIAFSGTRTYHRMACAIEDAGFEMRDQIGWLYGSGFPKSHDVSKGIDRAAGAEREKVARVRSDGKPTGYEGATFNACDVSLCSGPAITPAARQWEGWGTALKPAWEPVVLARKPLGEKTVAANVLRHGTGAINVDGCRVETTDDLGEQPASRGPNKILGKLDYNTDETWTQHEKGRWPANIILDGSEEVIAAFPQTDSGAFQRGETARAEAGKHGIYGRFNGAPDGKDFGPANSGSAARFFKSCGWTEDDLWNSDLVNFAANCSSLQSEAVVSALSNAVARSMPGSVLQRPSYRAPSTSATANELRLIGTLVTATIQSIALRCSLGLPLESVITHHGHARCAAIPEQTGTMTITVERWTSGGSAGAVTFSITLPNAARGASGSANRFHYDSKADADDRLGSRHPTVKPVSLMSWLVRLVTPPGGTVLDPFAGSGTTGMACMREGFDCILIEREAEYVKDIHARLAHVHGTDTPLFADYDPEANSKGCYELALQEMRNR